MIFLFCVIYINAIASVANNTTYSSVGSMTQQTPSPAEQAASQAAANTQAQLQQARGVQNAFATQSSADGFAPYGVTMQMSDQTNAVVTHALVGVAHQALGLGMDLADLMMAPINKAMASFGAGSVVQSLQASEAQIRASLANTTPAQQLGAEVFNVATLAFGEVDLVLSGLRGVGLFGSLGGGVQQALNMAAGLDMRSQILANIADTRAGINASNFGVHAAIESIPYLDVTTGLDQSVFWSGRGNRELAENFATNFDKLTLEMTPGGNYLNSLQLFTEFPYEQARIPWERLSEQFANNASGDAYAFVDGSNPTSIFKLIELPALLRNPNVSNVLYSPEFENQFYFIKK